MGCHSHNSIWELGSAQSWQSGSLTWQDCSWDPRAGQQGVWQASLAHSLSVLGGVWGWMDLWEASAVVRCWQEPDPLCKQPAGFGYQVCINTGKSCLLASQAALTISFVVPEVHGICLQQGASGCYN